MHRLGLIGYPLSHSFSKKYFTQKFKDLGITDWQYELYPLQDITQLAGLLKQESELLGLNVTIPYKVSILPLLDEIDDTAKEIGAVNTISIKTQGGKPYLKGYNTDASAFEETLTPILFQEDTRALVLGTGGAAKAVNYVLKKLHIESVTVSRNPGPGALAYEQLDNNIMSEHTIIVNTTPVGMYPENDYAPDIPYDAITPRHLLYDLIYSPEQTKFILAGLEAGARVKNGLEMLYLQAEKAWTIWTGSLVS